MKNIVCPLSDDRISESVPRIVASIVVFLLLAYIVTGSHMVLALLVVDFGLRSTNLSKYSLISKIAQFINKSLKIKSRIIDKAPKIFAARLGFVLASAALLLDFTIGGIEASVIAAMIAVFAGLECVLNFCLGCVIYNYLVFPFYSQKRS